MHRAASDRISELQASMTLLITALEHVAKRLETVEGILIRAISTGQLGQEPAQAIPHDRWYRERSLSLMGTEPRTGLEVSGKLDLTGLACGDYSAGMQQALHRGQGPTVGSEGQKNNYAGEVAHVC